MEITEVKVFPISEEKLKAFVSVVFDRCFMVNDIKIIQGREGLFISMPSRRKKNGQFKDVAHPLNNETRKQIEHRILTEYHHLIGDSEASEAKAPAPATAEKAEAPEPEKVEKPEEAAKPEKPAAEEGEAKSVEEVAEIHLRDSFWTS